MAPTVIFKLQKYITPEIHCEVRIRGGKKDKACISNTSPGNTLGWPMNTIPSCVKAEMTNILYCPVPLATRRLWR